MKEETKTHESYGMIDICKYTGGSGQFFGSDIIHNGGISLKIHTAEKKRMLSNNWYHSRNTLIEVRLSYAQWVDAITSGMNTSGVPCTIERFNGKSIPQKDHVEDKQEKFTQELKEMHTESKDMIDEVLDMLMDGNVGKRKKEEIAKKLSSIKQRMGGNESFVIEQFKEEMQDVVTEAKQSVSNYIESKINTYGIEAMREQMNVSIESKKDDDVKKID
jgi:hypothetical protein